MFRTHKDEYISRAFKSVVLNSAKQTAWSLTDGTLLWRKVQCAPTFKSLLNDRTIEPITGS